MTWQWVVLILGVAGILATFLLLFSYVDALRIRAQSDLERSRIKSAERRLQQ